jgi:hypothetical protein
LTDARRSRLHHSDLRLTYAAGGHHRVGDWTYLGLKADKKRSESRRGVENRPEIKNNSRNGEEASNEVKNGSQFLLEFVLKSLRTLRWGWAG